MVGGGGNSLKSDWKKEEGKGSGGSMFIQVQWKFTSNEETSTQLITTNCSMVYMYSGTSD